MRGKTVLIAVLGLVAAGLLVGWFLFSFERKTIDLPLPPKGEALYNPLYALKVSLLHAGQRVQSRPHLFDEKQTLHPDDTVLLLTDPARLNPRESNALLKHMAAGGHVILEAPLSAGNAETGVPVLGAFGVGEHVDADDCIDSAVLCSDRFALEDDADPVFAWEDDQGIGFARFRYGKGTLDVVASLEAARSMMLTNEHNAEFVRQWLQPNWGRGTFHLVYASEMPTLWRLLRDHAWRVIVALVLLVAAFLWMRMQRFGPLLPSPSDERRSLLEHVQATGDHLYRYGRGHLLHSALRAHVLAKLRRKDPIAAALEGQPQADMLATRTGLPATDILEALRSPRPFDAKDFRYRIARLIALGRHT